MDTFHEELNKEMNEYAHGVYAATRTFPRDEIYGVTSQLRRASLSVILNYIEGYARQRGAVNRNFLEISYGSLQESKYLLDFCLEEKYLNTDVRDRLMKHADRIGAMLWGTLKNFK